MAKSLQRKKPGFTKNGEIKVVSLNIPQLLSAREKASKKKLVAKLDKRLVKLGYVAPVAVTEETSN
jgi:hypothetical protein